MAGDVRGGERGRRDQLRGDLRLVLEHVEQRDDPVPLGDERGGVDHRAAGGVDEERAVVQRGELARPDQVPGRIGTAARERHVESQEVRAAEELGEGHETVVALGSRPRRVAEQHLAANRPRERRHPAPDVADADHPDPSAGERHAVPQAVPQCLGAERRRPPELDGVGVAARRGRPGDPSLGEPLDVEVVGAARHGADESDRARGEQRRVDAHRAPHPESLGAGKGRGSDLRCRERHDLSMQGEGLDREGDLGVDDESQARASGPTLPGQLPAGNPRGSPGFRERQGALEPGLVALDPIGWPRRGEGSLATRERSGLG